MSRIVAAVIDDRVQLFTDDLNLFASLVRYKIKRVWGGEGRGTILYFTNILRLRDNVVHRLNTTHTGVIIVTILIPTVFLGVVFFFVEFYARYTYA